MTFQEAMQAFPGLYSPADQAQFEEAQRAQQAINARQNSAPATFSPAAQQALATVSGSGFGSHYDLPGTGYGSAFSPVAPAPVSSGTSGQFLSTTQQFDPDPVSHPIDGQNRTVTTTAFAPPPTARGTTNASFNPTTYSQSRPDLQANWNNANNPGWVAAHPEAAGLVNQIKGYGSLNAYLEGDYNGTVGVGARAGGGVSAATGGGGGATRTTAAGANNSYTYQQLLQMYRDAHGGQNAGDDFNSWVGSQGITGWDDPTATAGDGGTTTISSPFGPPGVGGPTYGSNGRNLGGELNAIGAYVGPFSQAGFANAQKYNPLYTDLNVKNYNTALTGVAGSMRNAWDAANPTLAGYEGALGASLNRVAAGRPTGVGATGYDAATASPNYAPNAQQATVGGAFAPVNPNTGYSPVQAASGDYGLSSASSRLAGIGPSSIQQTLEQQASAGLALGRGLSAEDTRNAQQAAREGWSARGLVNSNGAVAEEVLNRDALGRQRENERRQFAQGVDQAGFAQRQQGFGSALGLSDASRGYAGLGLQAQQSNLGAQLTGNQLGLQGQLANQNTGLNYAQLGTQNSQFNAGQANQLGQYNANIANQMALANQGATNQAQQYNVGAVNAMNQFNQNLNLQGNQNNWNNAAQYGSFLQGNAFSPFGAAGQLSAAAPDYTGQLLHYGSDVYGTNFNAAAAANIARGNNNAALTGSLIGAGTSLLGAGINNGLFSGSGAGGGAGTGPSGPWTNTDYNDYDDLSGTGNWSNIWSPCWVARAVYGIDNPRWKIFRSWLKTRAPSRFRELYLAYGQSFAEYIEDKPELRAVIRAWMDARLEEYANGKPIGTDAFPAELMEVA